MIRSITLSALALGTVLVGTDASAFLQVHTSSDHKVAASIVAQALAAELSDPSNTERLRTLEQALLPLYGVLPKGDHGKLEPPSVRYAMHRYFTRKYGWHVNGLEMGSQYNVSSSSATIAAGGVPAYLQDLLAQRMNVSGVSLHDLAALVATLTDLVHKEALEHAFNILMASKHTWERENMQHIVRLYLAVFILGDSTEKESKASLHYKETEVSEIYPAWRGVKFWMKDLLKTMDHQEKDVRNPFVPKDEFTFKEVTTRIQEVGHRFGAFQNMECVSLKNTLLKKEYKGTGRVLLKDLYASQSGNNDWEFVESPAYLRTLGVLDDSDSDFPSVVIPNYLHSRTNCLSSSSFYSVCCLNECEDLMANLERQVASDTAQPAEILDIVSRLPSDTVNAPRAISDALARRLHSIADMHGGNIPLHGRLFAQWMHHVYPRECPFPHVAGTTRSVSKEEWDNTTPEGTADATRAERDILLKASVGKEPRANSDTLPWLAVEELVVPQRRSKSSFLRAAMFLMALVSSAVPLSRMSKVPLLDARPAEIKPDRFLV